MSVRPGYQITELGEIPEEWEVVRLQDVVTEAKTGFSSGKRDAAGIIQLRMNNISTQGRLVLDDLLKVPIPEAIEGYLVRQGDILFNNTNSVALIGKSAIFDDELGYVTYSNHITRIRVDTARVVPKWLLYILIRKWQLNYFRSICHRHVEQAGITGDDLLAIKVALPPLLEQQKIASMLSTVDDFVQKSDEIITQTQQLKKGLTQQLLTRGIGHTKFKETEIGKIPIEWEATRLGDCAQIKGGYAFKSSDYTNEGTPLIRITNVSHGTIDMDDVPFLPNSFLEKYGEFSLEEGDLVIVLTRPITGGEIKAARIGRNHLPALLNQRIGKIRIRHKGRLQSDYLFQVFFSRAFINQVRNGLALMNQPNISPREIEKFRIPLPPINEQIQISEILSTIDRKIEVENKNKQELPKIKIGLMSALLTGKIRVKET
jgi:type I restriction enzyme, S subunit